MGTVSGASAVAVRRSGTIESYRDLIVYQQAVAAAMELFELSKLFPKEERYSLTDQIRRSSRSAAVNLVEAWRKRRYKAAFISKLSDAETEAAETQAWLEFAVKCRYAKRDAAAKLYRDYDKLLAGIVGMIHHADAWIIRPAARQGV